VALVKDALDLRGMKDRAQALYASGRFAKAAELYQALADRTPKDAQLRMRHAESARRAGLALAAVGSYRTAARLLAQDGHQARARAALHLALELAPGHPDVTRALRELERARPDSISSALVRAAEAQHGALELQPIAIEVGEPEPLVPNVVALPRVSLPPARSSAAPFLRVDAQTVAFRRPDGAGWWVVHAATTLAMEEISAEDGEEANPLVLEEAEVG
jgi:tetratricopeptide (TPR) repeat protein